MKYENYEIWDFIQDDYFIHWVRDANPQTDQFWKKWIAHHPAKADDIMLAKAIVLGLRYVENDQPSEKEMIEMFEAIVKGRRKNIKLPGFNLTLLTKYAAILVLGIGLVASYLFIPRPGEHKHNITRVDMVEKTNPRGMKSTIFLSDGTKVRLNAESTIRYPSEFPDSSRVVCLEGEAFFNVKRNEAKPFKVIVDGVETEVLGTSFNVRAYSDEDEVQVGVTEGKVKVSGTRNNKKIEYHLLPNQMSIFNLKEEKAQKVTFNPDELLAWRTWTLKFKRKSLEEVFHEIERWYAVNIEVTNELDLEQSYSGIFENEPLDVVLKVLAHNADFTFQIEDNHVKIEK